MELSVLVPRVGFIRSEATIYAGALVIYRFRWCTRYRCTDIDTFLPRTPGLGSFFLFSPLPPSHFVPFHLSPLDFVLSGNVKFSTLHFLKKKKKKENKTCSNTTTGGNLCSPTNGNGRCRLTRCEGRKFRSVAHDEIR